MNLLTLSIQKKRKLATIEPRSRHVKPKKKKQSKKVVTLRPRDNLKCRQCSENKKKRTVLICLLPKSKKLPNKLQLRMLVKRKNPLIQPISQPPNQSQARSQRLLPQAVHPHLKRSQDGVPEVNSREKISIILKNTKIKLKMEDLERTTSIIITPNSLTEIPNMDILIKPVVALIRSKLPDYISIIQIKATMELRK